MKLITVVLVFVVAIYSSLCDAAKLRARSGKPLIDANKEYENQKPDVPSREFVLPEPLRVLGVKIQALLDKSQETSLEELTPEIMALFIEAESIIEKSNNTREARGLLDKLSFLTGLHFGSLFHGSGTVAATQSLTFLGRIVNSALSLSYGPTGNIVPSVLPVVPLGDEIPNTVPISGDDLDDTRIIFPTTNFLVDHNRRVEEINKRNNVTTESFRQGRRNIL